MVMLSGSRSSSVGREEVVELGLVDGLLLLRRSRNDVGLAAEHDRHAEEDDEEDERL